MAKVIEVKTVAGTVRGNARKVTYVLVKDDGKKETHTLDVTGNRDRVASLIASFHDDVSSAEDVTFDDNYSE